MCRVRPGRELDREDAASPDGGGLRFLRHPSLEQSRTPNPRRPASWACFTERGGPHGWTCIQVGCPTLLKLKTHGEQARELFQTISRSTSRTGGQAVVAGKAGGGSA